jgi:hypothetical protein
MKKILAALLLTLPTMAVAVDLEGYYITPKVGASKSMDTGTTFPRLVLLAKWLDFDLNDLDSIDTTDF